MRMLPGVCWAVLTLVLTQLGDTAFAQTPDIAGGQEPADAPPENAPRPCDPNFFKPCPEGLVCIDSRCLPPPTRGRVVPAQTSTAGGGRVVVRERLVDVSRPFRLGVTNGFLFGFAGQIKNPKPAYAISADFGFPTGRAVRWHVELGYEDLNGYTGFRVSPLVLGYAIPILRKQTRDTIELEVEILATVIQSEILFNDGFAISLSSGLRAQIVAVYGIGYAALAPLGFEVRYAYGVQNVGIATGVGANWPLLLTVGVEL